MKEQKFRKLEIWKRSPGFVEEIYRLTKTFPKEETYGLISQLRRAATSIVLNIAEGSAADSDTEFNRFLSIAHRTNYEVMCGLEIAGRLSYIDKTDLNRILGESDQLSAMVVGFKKRLKADS